MRDYRKFYIDGQWVDPVTPREHDVINPATGKVAGQISLGSAADVDKAAQAARRAFETFSQTSIEERIALLDRIEEEYKKRYKDVADAITEEIGAPTGFSNELQALTGAMHTAVSREVLRNYEFSKQRGSTNIVHEPIGVCGLITPWNWPINQLSAKVCPAIAVGCTVVVKPSEIAPFSAHIWAEIMDAAGVPAGVFNMVDGDGPGVGVAISEHPQIDMISFTGSTRAGIDVAQRAAKTVKRVHQELGGKSANIVLPDADLPTAIPPGIHALLMNTGQSCNAPTRLLVPEGKLREVTAIIKEVVEGAKIGDPTDPETKIGPVASEAQFDKIQRLIQSGIDQGATVVTGGVGRPEGFPDGYYVRPTVFADVTPDMDVVREEIFGPVLVVLTYSDEEEAIRIANDTEYGLAAYVQSSDIAHARKVASRLRAGQVNINNSGVDPMAPFGGYKMSGNGREWGDHAFAEFLETKAMLGFEPVAVNA